MSYAGCHHDVEAPIDTDNQGVLYLNSRVGHDDITDGSAFTILLGEILNGPSLGWASGTRATLRNTGHRINAQDSALATPRSGRSPYSYYQAEESLSAVGSMIEDGVLPIDFVGGFASRHPGCANFLLCDGSVRLMKQSIDERVYRLLANRADGDIIDAAAY
jgi:prepilin-type processing-associated H-X9-DG protein